MSVTDQLEAALPDGPRGTSRPTPKKSIWQFELTAKKVPRKELMHFSRQLAVFIKAGIPILDALETIHGEMGNKLFRSIIEDILNSLKEGETFADATARHETAFPPYYLGILRSAELTGQLDVALIQLSEYIERDVEARRKVSSAFAYPAVILAVSVVVVIVLVSFVLPKFESFFNSLGAKLPLPTRILLSVSRFLTGNWYLILAGVIATIIITLMALRTRRGKAGRDRLLLKLPVIGDLLRHVIL